MLRAIMAAEAIAPRATPTAEVTVPHGITAVAVPALRAIMAEVAIALLGVTVVEEAPPVVMAVVAAAITVEAAPAVARTAAEVIAEVEVTPAVAEVVAPLTAVAAVIRIANPLS